MTGPEGTKARRSKSSKLWVIVISVFLILGAIVWLLYFFLVRPLWNKSLNESLDLLENDSKEVSDAQEEKETDMEDAAQPICGEVDDLLILVVGSDYRSGDYEYGLADAIRIVHIDFTIPQVNVVALPRALLIEEPGPRLDVDAPILLNQAYFFGTSGMGHFSGSSFGAGAMAETLQTNFDLTIDNYLVVDFYAFKRFISLIGPIKINLPEPVYLNESESPYFPAGVQYLDAEQALQFARARAYTSDNVRIDNQSLLLKAIIQRLQEPEVILHLPELIEGLSDIVLTDLSLQQIQSFVCLLDNLESKQIQFFNPDTELIEDDRVFIPSMDKEMNVYLWEQALVDWLFESLWVEP